MQTIGKKPSADGATTLAVVRWGPMGISNSDIEAARKQGKKVISAYTEAQVHTSFRKDIETDAAVGRVKNIRTNFIEKKYDGGSCLLFSQTGVDTTPKGPMPILNEGKMCFNSVAYRYLILNLSARVLEGKKLPDMSSERSEFFESVKFVKN